MKPVLLAFPLAALAVSACSSGSTPASSSAVQTVPSVTIPVTSDPESASTPESSMPPAPTVPADRLEELFELLPKVDEEPVTSSRTGASRIAYYRTGFDEFVAAQRAALEADGWSFDADVPEAGRWAFLVSKGELRLGGGVLDCTSSVELPDGTQAPACGESMAEIYGDDAPKVQLNVTTAP